jgi:preprotein translocase subunit SecA
MLRRRGIPHSVLNAKYHAKEAEIIAQAGRKGAVTVATNMAGRGTDILLGGNPEFLAAAELRARGLDPDESPDEYASAWEDGLPRWKKQCDEESDEVVEAGGLYVLGTERHESRRIDNQLRGRSGRQGDPGESRFYLSLQDELMKRFRAGAVEAVMDRLNIPEDMPIESKMVSRQIKSAQTQIEAQNAEIRKDVLKYDEVLNKQRLVIYAERRRVLNGEDLHEQIRHMIDDVIAAYVSGATGEGYAEDWDLEQLFTGLRQLYPVGITVGDLEDEAGGKVGIDAEFLTSQLTADAHAAYDAREKELGAEPMRELERQVLLAVIDRKWREHLYEMDYLKDGVGLRAYAQRDPLVEYQREGFDMFAQMLDGIKEEAVGFLFNIEVQVEEAPAEVEVTGVGAAPVEIHAKGLGGGRRQQALQYSAPTIDGAAGAGGVVVDEAPAAPALGVGRGPASATATGAKKAAPGQAVGTGPSRNAPCPCGSGKKYKRCHGAPS